MQYNLTESEWELIEPLLPEQGRMGRSGKTDLRRICHAIPSVNNKIGCLYVYLVPAQKIPDF